MNLYSRSQLKTGDIITLDYMDYYISGIRGCGSSCIVYDADNAKGNHFLIKEFYPVKMNITRDSSTHALIIPPHFFNRFNEQKARYKKSAELQMQFRNQFETTNTTAYLQGISEAYSTIYTLSPTLNGVSLDKFQIKDLTDILEIVQSLCDVIFYYHQKGYLFLDIKPSNIFVFKETRQLIQLFDFDTVICKDDLSSGQFSYSENYAAPEVINAKLCYGDYENIDERADIYSIGAVLFELLTGNPPEIEDTRKGAKWNFSENSYLKNAEPQLVPLITSVLRKMLALSPKNRYPSVSERLKEDINKCIRLSREKIFLKSHTVSPCTPPSIYLSREKNISDISSKLQKYHILSIYGIGGSGKSETVREYAQVNKDNYSTIHLVHYSGDLRQTIADLDFVGLKENYNPVRTQDEIERLCKYKIGLLGNTDLYDDRTLLIIDNFDFNVDPSSEEYKQNSKVIAKLKTLKIHILFTTRVNTEQMLPTLALEDFSVLELRKLFFNINPEQKNNIERIHIVDRIIEASYHHTMTVRLIAAQSVKYKRPLYDYLNILKEKGIDTQIKGRITNNKDDHTITAMYVYEHIRDLFRLDSLNNKEQYIMVNSCLLPLSGMNAVRFGEMIDIEHFDNDSDSDCLDESIEDLISSGWLLYSDKACQMISIHPLISEIVRVELKPDATNSKCRKFFIAYLELLHRFGEKKPDHQRAFSIASQDPDTKLIGGLNEAFFKIFHYAPVIEVFTLLLTNPDHYIFDYSVFDNKNNLVRYFGIDEKYTIPDFTNGIYQCAFDNCTFLKTLVFSGRNNVLYADLLSEAEDEKLMMSGSAPLRIGLPFPVADIVTDSFCPIRFQNCPIERFKSSSPSYRTINGVLYNSEGTVLLRCPPALRELSVPPGVKGIYHYAFINNEHLERVFLPESIDIIGNYAFADCTNITKVCLPDYMALIGDGAFYHCEHLKHISIPEGIIFVGVYAFSSCQRLIGINIPASVMLVDSNAFENCTALSDLSFSSSSQCRMINKEAFLNCISLNAVYFPKNLLQIQDNAFCGCSSLYEIKLSDRSTKIAATTFTGCKIRKGTANKCIRVNGLILEKRKNGLFLHSVENKDISHVIIPDNVVEIADNAFSGCSNLEEIIIPQSVQEIGFSAFENCRSLRHVEMTGTGIAGGYAFSDCISLESICLCSGMSCIQTGMFSGCTSLTSIVLPKQLERIEDEAFYGCSSLQMIELPDHVTKIGSSAFENCSSLSAIMLNDEIRSIGKLAFSGTAINACIVPESVERIGKQAMINCRRLYAVMILNPELDPKNWGAELFFDNEQIYIKNDMQIVGYSNSPAEKFAKSNQYNYIEATEDFFEWLTDTAFQIDGQ